MMSCGDQFRTPHGLRSLPAWMAVCVLLCACIAARAADPTILDLQRELKSLFPPMSPAVHAAPFPEVQADNPYAIVEHEFLLARAPDLDSPSVRLSLRQLRRSTPAIRTAHAACVKIITPYWHGAGVLVSPDGDVLTSHHLVAGVPCASVQTLDGRIHTVTNITAASVIHDLALLRIDGGPYPCLSVDTSPDPPRGSILHIVGHPGNTPWKLTRGAVVRRMADRGTQVLHFDADVARGNSGGPIVDEAGRLLAITACSAELADGSTVKIGIAAPAIRSFLAEPRVTRDFAALARFERNRRMTEFLGQLYVMMDAWIAEWLASMSQVTLERTEALQGHASAPGTRFTNTRKAAEVSARLLLLKALMVRCALLQDIDAPLASSIADGSAVLDTLMDSAMLLGGRTGASTREAADIIARLRHCRQEAEQRFDKALSGVQRASTQFNLDITDPLQSRYIAGMRSRYNLPGCRVQP